MSDNIELQKIHSIIQQGGYTRAIEQLRALLAKGLESYAVFQFLGFCYINCRQYDQACEVYQYAQTKVKEPLAKASLYSDWAVALYKLKKLDAAIAKYKQALKIAPEFVAALNSLGELYRAKQHYSKAEFYLAKAANLEPNNLANLNNRALLFADTKRYSEAIELLTKVITITPSDAQAHNNLANIYLKLDEIDKAKYHYKVAIELQPDSAVFLYNMGKLFYQQGEADQAMRLFESALVNDPMHAESNYLLSQKNTQTFSTERIQRLIDYSNNNPERPESIYYTFAVANIYHNNKAYSQAFSFYEKANALYYSQHKKAILKSLKINKTMQSIYSRKVQRKPFIIDSKESGISDKVNELELKKAIPIFILGLPRTGSTLIEQVLASHSAVTALGERNELPEVLRTFFHCKHIDDLDAEKLDATLSSKQINVLREHYIKSLPKEASSTRYFTDKLPRNFLYIGLIRQLFPEAIIIHTKRNIKDTVLSNFQYLFSGEQFFSYNLETLFDYINHYLKLMKYWHSIKNVRLLDLSYESLITDTEKSIRGLLDYCDLLYEPSCLNFYENRRNVKTISTESVRKPIYKNALGRWKNYSAYLEMFDKLD